MPVKTAVHDLAVIGGGPAGCAAAITAARRGARVILVERGRYPRHKVCGEFVSPEALGLLASLLEGRPGADTLKRAPRIGQARIFLGRQTMVANVSPPAASITRYQLDQGLWQAAAAGSCDCREDEEVLAVEGCGPFRIQLREQEEKARTVVNATGRWSRLSAAQRVEAARRAGQKWIGIKAHFREDGPPASVDLYVGRDGYCGVQPVGQNLVNVCAMVQASAGTLEQILPLHAELWRRSRGWQQVSESVTTAPLIFGAPQTCQDGVLLAGDAAGFIDPFVGDGISLALHSGTLAAQALAPVWEGRQTLQMAAEDYREAYKRCAQRPFRQAARLRRLLRLPAPMRDLLVACGGQRLARSLVATTRVAVVETRN